MELVANIKLSVKLEGGMTKGWREIVARENLKKSIFRSPLSLLSFKQTSFIPTSICNELFISSCHFFRSVFFSLPFLIEMSVEGETGQQTT